MIYAIEIFISGQWRRGTFRDADRGFVVMVAYAAEYRNGFPCRVVQA
jgi:hypothetical protein